MSEGHRLHEAQHRGRASSRRARSRSSAAPAPAGIALVELSGELDIAATLGRARVRRRGRRAPRRSCSTSSGATFVDSSMLKELLRANAELGALRHAARAGGRSRPPCAGVLDLTRTDRAVHARRRPRRRRSRCSTATARPRARARRRARRARSASRSCVGGAGADPREAGVQEVVARRGGEHRVDGARGGGRVQAQADERERGPRARAARAGEQLADRVAQPPPARAPVAAGPLLHERLADPRLDLLVHDQLGERERRGGQRGDLRARDRRRGRAPRARCRRAARRRSLLSSA